MGSPFSVIFTLVAIAYALPQPGVIGRSSLACEVIDDVVNLLKAESAATPFCSSFLGIGTTTHTSTAYFSPAATAVTSTEVVTGTVQQTIDSIVTNQIFDTLTSQVTNTYSAATTTVVTDLFTSDFMEEVAQTDTLLFTNTLTATVTDTTTESDTVSFTSLVKATVTDTIISTSTSVEIEKFTQTSTVLLPDRRGLQERATPIPTPSAFKTLGSRLLSAGCSCLDIPTPTTTMITTSILPEMTSTVYATVSIQTTSQTTSSATIDVTSDITIDATADVTNTYTDISTAAVTVTSSTITTLLVDVSFTLDVTATATTEATSQSTLDVTAVITTMATADILSIAIATSTEAVITSVVTSSSVPCGTDAPNLVQNSAFNFITNYYDWNVTETGSGTFFYDEGCEPDNYCALFYVSGPGSITFQQTLSTVPSQMYALSYSYRRGATNGTFTCSAGSATLSPDPNADEYSWTEASTTFGATSYQTNLVCTGICTTSSCAVSTNLDAVTVQAVC